jgi:hypothetical protein
MASRVARSRAAVRRWERRLPIAITVLVFTGLAASGLVNIWVESPTTGTLPSIALGSQALLVAERSVAFFAIWMLVLVVSVEALEGRLPIEISGRGVRYADGDETHDGLLATRQTLAALETETEALWRAVEDLAAQTNDH